MGIFEEYAQEIFEHGLSVIPCKGKRTFIKDWSNFSKRLPSKELVDEWIKSNSKDNIGIVCGKASGIVAFDIDTDSTEVLELIFKALPKSPVIKRGSKGMTLFYKYSGQPSSVLTYKGKAVVDILSDGRQTVIPPSVHPDTKEPYKWDGPALWDVLNELPPLPLYTIRDIEGLLDSVHYDRLSENAADGRNNALKKLVMQNINAMNTDDLAKFIYNKDKELFDNPLFSDRRECSDSDAYTNAYTFVSNIKKSYMKGDKNGPVATPANNYPTKKMGFYKVGDKQKEYPQFHELAEYFRDELSLKVSESFSYIYDKTHYRLIGPKEIGHMINELTLKKATDSHLKQFRGIIDATCYKRNDFFDFLPGHFNLKNGVLNVKTKTLMPHSPDFFFTETLRYDYDPEAECPMFIKFLYDVFSGDEELVDITFEIFAYCLFGGKPRAEISFVPFSTGRSGKSTWLDTLRALLGNKNVSAVSMREINEKFERIKFHTSLANIIDESPEKVEPSIFKNLVGGGIVSASHKFKDSIDLRVKCRFFFSCNEMPVFGEHTVAIKERLLFIPFMRFYKVGQRDTKIGDKILSELSGILNKCIEAHQAFSDRGHLFEMPKASSKMLDSFERQTDSVQMWAEDKLEWSGSDNDFLETNELYLRYSNWCNKYGFRPCGLSKFQRRVGSIYQKLYNDNGLEFNNDADGRKYLDNARVRGAKKLKYYAAEGLRG